MKLMYSVVALMLAIYVPCKASFPGEEDIVQHKVKCVFESTGQFKRDVTPTVIDVFGRINQNWRYPEADEKISTKSRFWIAKYIKANAETAAANLKTVARVPTLVMTCKPQQILEALNDLVATEAVLECTIATKTAEIFALREILGDQLFQTFVVEFHTIISAQPKWNMEEFFGELPLQFIERMKGPAIPRSFTYITNLTIYSHFKPHGNSAGYNCFCCGEDSFIGFDEMFKAGPCKLSVIEDEFYTELLDKDAVENDREGHVKFSSFLKNEAFLKLRAQQQKQIDQYWCFSAQKVLEYLLTGAVEF